MSERFAPSVVVPGVGAVVPEGWMWVLGFALGGCEWAIRECCDPAFDLRGKMLDYERRRSLHFTEQSIAELERRLAGLRDTAAALRGSSHG